MAEACSNKSGAHLFKPVRGDAVIFYNLDDSTGMLPSDQVKIRHAALNILVLTAVQMQAKWIPGRCTAAVQWHLGELS